MNGILSVSQNITEAQMWDGTMLAAIVSIGRTHLIIVFYVKECSKALEFGPFQFS